MSHPTATAKMATIVPQHANIAASATSRSSMSSSLPAGILSPSSAGTPRGAQKQPQAMPKISSNTTTAAAPAELEARQKALRQTSSEDERRMRFLALLCGRGAFKQGDRPHRHHNPAAAALGRERSGSVGGMGIPNDENSKVSGKANNNGLNASLLGKGATNNTASVGGGGGATGHAQTMPTAAQTSSSQSTGDNHHDLLPLNYQPTMPSNLSRRQLHKSGVGYLDASLPLLLSALSDRFLATVLVQAMACRDRRLEGRKAILKERRRRKRHRKRVLRERRDREKRFRDEMERRRASADGAVRDAADLDSPKKKGAPAAGSSGASGGSATAPVFQLREKDREAAQEYSKQAKDVDDEEDYYNAYYGKKGDDDGDDDDCDSMNDSDDEEDDGSEDELLEDEAQFDLKLRDLVRPLSAWGFDLTGKLGFADNEDEEDKSDEEEYEDDNDADDADGGGSDEDNDDEDQDDANNEDAINSEDDQGDLNTTDDEMVGPKKKKANNGSPKKKKPKRRSIDSAGGGGKRPSGDAGSTTGKKKVTKRKRDDKDDSTGGGAASNKVDGKPKAKKAAIATATTASSSKEIVKKLETEMAVGGKGLPGNAKKE